jgi:hypothetical protein
VYQYGLLHFGHTFGSSLLSCQGTHVCSEGSYAFSRRVSVASDLWSKYRTWKELTPDEEAIVLQDYFEDGSELYLESQLVGAGEVCM